MRGRLASFSLFICQWFELGWIFTVGLNERTNEEEEEKEWNVMKKFFLLSDRRDTNHFHRFEFDASRIDRSTTKYERLFSICPIISLSLDNNMYMDRNSNHPLRELPNIMDTKRANNAYGKGSLIRGIYFSGLLVTVHVLIRSIEMEKKI